MKTWTLTWTDGEKTKKTKISCPLDWTKESISNRINANSMPLETNYSSLPPGWWIEKISCHGGARANSGAVKGSGKYGESTKVVRVPISKAEKIEDILDRYDSAKNLIDLLKDEADNSTSPRYHHAKKMLEELKLLLS